MIRGEAKDYLVFPANIDEDKYLNLALESLLRGYEGENSRDVVSFVVQPDENGEGFITMPRRYLAIRGAVTGCGYPLRIRNGWYEYAPGAIGMKCGSDAMRGIIPLQGRYTTLSNWNVPLYLRFKFEQNETSGTIIVRGRLVGQQIWTVGASGSTEGENVDYAHSDVPAPTSQVTTVNVFDEPPYQIIKPVTKGRVRMYTVDGDGNETLVAIYEPSERSPRWKRYKVPILPSPNQVTVVPVPIGGIYTAGQIETFFGGFTPLTVNADGSRTLSPSAPYSQWYQRINAEAGSGAYTYVLRLSRNTPLSGAIFRIQFEIEQSANPTIEVYDDDELTPLQTISGDSSNTTSALLECEFQSGAWSKIGLNFLT